MAVKFLKKADVLLDSLANPEHGRMDSLARSKNIIGVGLVSPDIVRARPKFSNIVRARPKAESRTKGQGTLEMALVLILMVLLLGGITNIWLWGSKQIVQRQVLYNQGRVLAGTSREDYKREWPLANPATGTPWRPESLGEGKVLLGGATNPNPPPNPPPNPHPNPIPNPNRASLLAAIQELKDQAELIKAKAQAMAEPDRGGWLSFAGYLLNAAQAAESAIAQTDKLMAQVEDLQAQGRNVEANGLIPILNNHIAQEGSWLGIIQGILSSYPLGG